MSTKPGAGHSWRRYHKVLARCLASHRVIDAELSEARAAYLATLAAKVALRVPLFGSAISRTLKNSAALEEGLLRAVKLHYRRGEWQEMRLLRTAAEDIGLSLAVTDPHGSSSDADLMLSAVEAFSHANNVVGQSSAYRREIGKSADRCEELLESLLAFGHSAEFWKAYTAFAPHISDRRKRLYCGFAISELIKCQYGAFSKVIYLVLLLRVSR